MSKYEACSIKHYVLFDIKYKTAKHENAENRTMSHECKLNVQMLITQKVFVEKKMILKYVIFTIFLIWHSKSEIVCPLFNRTCLESNNSQSF